MYIHTLIFRAKRKYILIFVPSLDAFEHIDRSMGRTYKGENMFTIGQTDNIIHHAEIGISEELPGLRNG